MKKFLNVCSLLILLFVVVGCGGRGTDLPENAIPEELDSSEIKITMWHAIGQSGQAVLDKIIEEFNKKYPNIKVEHTSKGGYEELKEALTSSFSAGTQPTIAQTYPDHVAVYMDAGGIRQIDDYINHSKWGIANDLTYFSELEGKNKPTFIEGFWEENSKYSDGKTYNLPFNKSTEVFYYNTEIFAKYGWDVPQTWEDIVDVSRKWLLTDEYKAKQLEYPGKKLAGFSYDSESNLFITMTQQWGGEYTGFGSNGRGSYLFDNAKSKEAIKFYKDACDEGLMVTSSILGDTYSSAAFQEGRIIMTLGSSAGSSYNDGSNYGFTTGVAPYPQKEGVAEADKMVIQQGTNISLFKSEDAQQELAGWLFIKHLTSKEMSLLWSMNTGYFPTRNDALESQEYQDFLNGVVRDVDGNPIQGTPTLQAIAQKVGMDQSKYFYTSEAFLGSSRCREKVGLIVSSVLVYTDGEINNMTVAQFIDFTFKDVLSTLK